MQDHRLPLFDTYVQCIIRRAQPSEAATDVQRIIPLGAGPVLSRGGGRLTLSMHLPGPQAGAEDF